MLIDYLAQEVAARGYECKDWGEYSYIKDDQIIIQVAVTLI